MTHAELFATLKSLGLPVAHNDFKSSPSLPYLIYKESDASAWGSDERNEIRKTSWIIELYAAKKDLETQSKIESLLDDRGLNWSMDFSDLIETEGLYLTAYVFETTTKIRRAIT